MNQEQQNDLFSVLSEKTEEEPLSEWQLEYGKHLLTKFDKEKSKEMTVEEWCSATLRILNSFSGTKMLKLISMMDSVEIEGWEKDKMVLWKYDEKSLSEFIIQKWHQVYSADRIYPDQSVFSYFFQFSSIEYRSNRDILYPIKRN